MMAICIVVPKIEDPHCPTCGQVKRQGGVGYSKFPITIFYASVGDNKKYQMIKEYWDDNIAWDKYAFEDQGMLWAAEKFHYHDQPYEKFGEFAQQNIKLMVDYYKDQNDRAN
jgi:hypothetical protein